jgi:YVTN family beta-propeller protein
MKRHFCNLRYLWILLAIPLAASTARIYVMNNAGDTVDVIDPVTDKVVQVIEGIEVPHGAIFAPDGKRAYITNESETVLNVVDTKTAKTIKKVPLSGEPNLPAVTKDGKRVLICIFQNPPKAAVDIVDTTTLTKVKSIPMRGRMHDVFTTPDGKYAIAGSDTGGFASIIDLKTEEPVGEIKFDEGAGVLTMAIETAPDGSTSRLFVQNFRLNGFTVVDFKKREVVSKIKFPDDPGGYDGGTNPSHGSAISPDGKTFWINSQSANAAFVYSLPDLKLVGHVSMPELKIPGQSHAFSAGPHWLTFTPDGKKVYIANKDSGSVAAIDVKTMKVVANIPAGEAANSIATLVIP